MGFKRILSSLTLNYLVATWTCSLICSGASTQFQKAEENVKALLKGQFDEKVSCPELM